MQPPVCHHHHSYCRPTVTCGVLRGARERHTDLRLWSSRFKDTSWCGDPPQSVKAPGNGTVPTTLHNSADSTRPKIRCPCIDSCDSSRILQAPRTPFHMCCCPAGTHTCGRPGTWAGGTPADSCRLSLCSFTEGTYCGQKLFPWGLGRHLEGVQVGQSCSSVTQLW